MHRLAKSLPRCTGAYGHFCEVKCSKCKVHPAVHSQRTAQRQCGCCAFHVPCWSRSMALCGALAHAVDYTEAI